jgi:hypothetical protein
VLAASGAVFAAAAGKGTQECVASALFVGAAVLIAINALGETGMRDRGVDPVVGMAYPGAGSSPQGSFRWVLVGFALIGFGVLTLVV